MVLAHIVVGDEGMKGCCGLCVLGGSLQVSRQWKGKEGTGLSIFAII